MLERHNLPVAIAAAEEPTPLLDPDAEPTLEDLLNEFVAWCDANPSQARILAAAEQETP